MNNKVLLSIMVICLIGIIGASTYFILAKSRENTTIKDNNSITDNEKYEEENISQNNKIAIIYFSATGTTRTVAEFIKNTTNGDLIEMIPSDKYISSDLDYGNTNSRANEEQNDSLARPKISNNIHVKEYDTIYLGYPIWWGDVPKIILTFLDTYDLSGKIVIPFCTSHSSGISQSLNTLRNYDKKVNWVSGKRFGNTSQTEIDDWIKSLKL